MLSCFFIAKMATLVHLWKTMRFWQEREIEGEGERERKKTQSSKGNMRSLALLLMI